MLSFSPSGRRAAILNLKFRQMVIADVTPARWTAFRSAPAGFRYVSQSAWLNDDTLLFVGKREGDRGLLWSLDVNTGVVTPIAIEGLWLRDQLVVAPDRRSVAVTATNSSGAETRWSIWTYGLTDHRVRRLTHGDEDIVSSWR